MLIFSSRHSMHAGMLQRRNKTQGRVLVIGAGVSGMTTARQLQEEGLQVTIVADQFPPAIHAAGGYVSVVAGALWEYPPGVCGRHREEGSLQRSRRWSLVSYKAFDELSRQGVPGVEMVRAHFYFPYTIEDRPDEYDKMMALRARTKGFRRGVEGLWKPDPRFDDPQIRDGYSMIAPTIDTNAYMVWLQNLLQEMGVHIAEETIDTGRPLRAQEPMLRKRFGAQAIVNCTGLRAAHLVPDATMSPLRGALVRMRNDGKKFPKIKESYCIAHDEHYSTGHGFIFIVPRGDILLLGGIAEPGKWSLDVRLDNHAPFREMLQRCIKFMPELRHAETAEEPLRIGLRPFTPKGVRLFREPGTRIIHNYGHGGSGFSLSYGCAQEVATLLHDKYLI